MFCFFIGSCKLPLKQKRFTLEGFIKKSAVYTLIVSEKPTEM